MIAKRTRILFFAEAVTLAHLVRPLTLAKTLDDEHYEIYFACPDRFPFAFQGEAIDRLPLDSISSQQFLSALAKGKPVYDLATLEGYLVEDLRLIENVEPDLVVGDFRLSLSVSARLSGIPYANLTNAYWSPYAADRELPLPDLPMNRWLGERIAGWLFRMAAPGAFRQHAYPLNSLRKRHNMEPLPDLRHAYTDGDYSLYCDLPELIPTQNLPPNHRYVGPITWSPNTPLPEWWNEMPNDRPIAYVNLGSSGRHDIIPAIVTSLLREGMAVIVVGDLKLQDVRQPNVWSAPQIPGELACERAEVVICNGGSLGVYQALAAGRPVLGIPSNLDQHLNMRAVCHLGAGRSVRPENVARLNDAMHSLLTEKCYRDSAERLRQEVEHVQHLAQFHQLLAEISPTNEELAQTST